MKTLNIISTTIALTACCSFFTPVMAETPDGETPAEELVCDEAGLTGALKGLCNAYCEAMDCDSDDPHASAKACDKVLGNYAKHAEPGETIPCEGPQVECPCAADYASAVAQYNAAAPGAIPPWDFCPGDGANQPPGAALAGDTDVGTNSMISLLAGFNLIGDYCRTTLTIDGQLELESGFVFISSEEKAACEQLLTNICAP